MRSARFALAAVLLILAVIVAIVGVLYLHDTAHALPKFIPGHHKHSHHKYSKRAVGAFIVALVLLALSGFTAGWRNRRSLA